MTPEMPDRPPGNTSLRWLHRVMKSLTWLIMGGTVLGIILYSFVFFSQSYPLLDIWFKASCGMFAIGGVIALFFLALTKITEIWAEIVDSSAHKTLLLETLLSDPLELKPSAGKE